MTQTGSYANKILDIVTRKKLQNTRKLQVKKSTCELLRARMKREGN